MTIFIITVLCINERMNHGGRPSHDFWENGGYERRQEGKKIMAYCLVCKRTLANTAKSRLLTHR